MEVCYFACIVKSKRMNLIMTERYKYRNVMAAQNFTENTNFSYRHFAFNTNTNI